ncbi:DNA helicase [Bertholletia excelsa]
MADAKKRQPLSLNDRHNRLLQDLSASQTRSISKPRIHQDDKSGAKVLDLYDDAPRFSKITDFDSPSPATDESIAIETEKLKDCGNPTVLPKLETDLSGVTDSNFNSHVEEKSKGAQEVCGTTCFTSHREEKKSLKVKMEGRRRLCKILTRDGFCEYGDHDDKSRNTDEDLEYSGLADFDSPVLSKNAVERENESRNEIRDILTDLSSRLELLSIEKKGASNNVEFKEELSASPEGENYNHVKNEDVPKNSSAAASFPVAWDSFNSSSGGKDQEARGVDQKSLPVGQNFVEQDEDDDCVILSGKKLVKNSSAAASFPVAWDSFNSSSGGKDQEARGADQKPLPVGQNFVEQDEDDDCVILSGKKLVKERERQDSKFQEAFGDYENDDFISEDVDAVKLEGPNSKYLLPGKIANLLFPHQRDGLKWLWSLHCQGKGGILGDDMGLGKTMQICGFLAGLFHSCLIKRALVVAPKTLLPHWMKELSAVGLSGETREYFGTCARTRQYELQYVFKDKGVLLTTYDIVRNNAKSLCGDYCFHGERSDNDIVWDYMILDEGHLIKNPSTQRAKSLLQIPSSHRIIISGTPIQNNLKEFWALFNFCCPELLGDNNWFKEKYESAILRGNDKNASDREKYIGSRVAKELRERVQPYFLRRLKSEVFCEDDKQEATKLSKKNEIIVWLKLTSCQRQLYEAFLKSELVLSAFDGSPLAALTILKKICDHPLLLTKRAAEDILEGMDSMVNQEDSVVAEKLAMHMIDVTKKFDFQESEKHGVSCKISFILSLLDNLILEGHFILIFSQTRKMLNLIQEALMTKSYKFLRIDGTTKASERARIVNDFQDGIGAPIFLLTSQVGGLGLTLTKADRVIVVDPAWNPSTDNQSVDRAYRIGQTKDVIVYRLMTCGTVEEKIYRKQIFKGGLFRTATEHKEQTRYFSQQDLRELFSLPRQGFDVSLTQQQLHEEHAHQQTMDEYLRVHIKFLETQGIAGISHHSLLFSKTAPAPVVQEEEIASIKGTRFKGNSSSNIQLECNVDWVKNAFNPKDVGLYRNNSLTGNTSNPSEEVKERIKRLSQILSNKVLVSKLPDNGDNIQKQIAKLKSELDLIQMKKRTPEQVICLDISDDFQKVLKL